MNIIILIIFYSLAFASIPSKSEQFHNSFKIVLQNATMPDVMPGMVVASPSKIAPNYYFDWVRDTALTMRSLIDYYELTRKPSIKKLLFNWIHAEAFRQNLPTLSGLGEPKFNIDGSGYSGPWGRPQNDGPALRALAMIKFARLLINEGDLDFVIKNLYHGILPADSIIKKDLEYVAHHWGEHSFDLWEEEKGMHFYTLLVQHVALQEGAKLASELKDFEASFFYQQESKKIGDRIKSDFMDDRVGIIVTSEKSSGLDYKTSQLDIAPLLALIHTSPYQKLIPLSDPFVFKYIEKLTKTFSQTYDVNLKYQDLGIGLGRYPEDRYDGYETTQLGNPWFLSTLALGEFYCLLSQEKLNQRQLTSRMEKEFSVKVEKQFARVLFHSDRKGHFSEQFNHQSGLMQGAEDLTWSHNSFMTAFMRCHFFM
jgi:glucoamylase